jgi:hypothetical protein
MLFRYFKYFCAVFFVSTITKAEEPEKNVMSIGQFAKELTPPVGILGDFITTGSLILGVVCFFWGFLQFLEYRKNPYTAPLSSVFSRVLPAIALVSLPFLSIILGVEVNPLQK